MLEISSSLVVNFLNSERVAIFGGCIEPPETVVLHLVAEGVEIQGRRKRRFLSIPALWGIKDRATLRRRRIIPQGSKGRPTRFRHNSNIGSKDLGKMNRYWKSHEASKMETHQRGDPGYSCQNEYLRVSQRPP